MKDKKQKNLLEKVKMILQQIVIRFLINLIIDNL
jgi:hypothetical protein